MAVDDARLVGFICVFGKEDPTWGSYIDNLHVAPDCHRRGIGAALMRSAASWLCDRYPGLGVYLWVMEANESARRFYERIGAKDAGITVKADPGGGRAPNCRYVWQDSAILRQAAAYWMRGDPKNSGEKALMAPADNQALVCRWLKNAEHGFTEDFGQYFSQDFVGHLGGQPPQSLEDLVRHTTPVMRSALALYLRMVFVLQTALPDRFGVPYAVYTLTLE